jgi:hypothetical protein
MGGDARKGRIQICISDIVNPKFLEDATREEESH